MFIGMNTNVRHKGEIFHVQTEDSGLSAHMITTLLFKDGAIISSKKASYKDISKSDSYEETVKEMMKEMHKQMLRDLVRGKVGAITPDQPGAQKGVQKKTRVKKHKGVGAQEQARPKGIRPQGLDGLIFDYLAKKEETKD